MTSCYFGVFWTPPAPLSCLFYASFIMLVMQTLTSPNLLRHFVIHIVDISFHASVCIRSLLVMESLRIDNSGWSVNSSALFDVTGMRWYQTSEAAL